MSEEERTVNLSGSGETQQEGPVAPAPTPPEGGQPAPGPQIPPPSGPAVPRGAVDETASDDDRLMAALAWVSMAILQIPLVSLVLLVAEENKKRPFQRFHAVNSMIFWVAGFIYEIIAVVVYIVLTIITLGCLGLFLWVIFFLPHLAAFYYAFQAYQGKRSEVPFITEFARSQRWV
jgi:uncharacterized membrane protein